MNIGGWGGVSFVKPPTGKSISVSFSFRGVRASEAGRGEAKLRERARGDSILVLGRFQAKSLPPPPPVRCRASCFIRRCAVALASAVIPAVEEDEDDEVDPFLPALRPSTDPKGAPCSVTASQARWTASPTPMRAFAVWRSGQTSMGDSSKFEMIVLLAPAARSARMAPTERGKG